MGKKTLFYSICIALPVWLAGVSAMAQEEPTADVPAPVAEESVAPAETVEASTDDAAASTGKNLAEDPNVGYHSVGLRFRWIFVPKWFITMFGVDIHAQNEKHPLISNLGFGVEYTYRKNNFDITAAIWGAQLDWEDPIYFKNGGEPDSSWTEVRNGLSALLFTADFIWSTPITNMVAITYGVGLGMGVTIGGDIIQTEGYVDSDGALNPCDGPNDPGRIAENDVPYCESDGEYHEVYDKLKVVPWINGLFGVRIKPHEHMALYVDAGFGLGFQMGVRGGYIF
jgi:hypothetical protein